MVQTCRHMRDNQRNVTTRWRIRAAIVCACEIILLHLSVRSLLLLLVSAAAISHAVAHGNDFSSPRSQYLAVTWLRTCGTIGSSYAAVCACNLLYSLKSIASICYQSPAATTTVQLSTTLFLNNVVYEPSELSQNTSSRNYITVNCITAINISLPGGGGTIIIVVNVSQVRLMCILISFVVICFR